MSRVRMHDTSLALVFDNGLSISIAQGDTRPRLGCDENTAEVGIWHTDPNGVRGDVRVCEYRTAEQVAEDIASVARGEVPDWALTCPYCGEPAGPCECDA